MEHIELQAPPRAYNSLAGQIQTAAQAIYRYALWLLVPVTILLLGSGRWELIGLVGAVGLLATRWVAFASPLPQTRLNLPILVLLAMTAVALSISSDRALAIPAATKTLAAVLVYFVICDKFESLSDIWNLAGVLVLLGVLFAYATPLSVSWMSDKVFSAGFFYDRNWTHLIEAINPNKMAGSIAPVVPLAVALLFAPKRWLRILGAVSLPPMLGIIVLLQSRAVFGALVAGFFVYLGLASRKLLPYLIIVLALTGIALLLFPNLVPRSVFESTNPDSATVSLAYRFELWKLSMPLLAESPWVGIGLGAFPDVAQARFPHMLGETQFSHPHNMFLFAALDTGILGGLAFIGVLIGGLVALWRAYRANVAPALCVGLFAAFAVLLVNGTIDSIFWATKPAFILWAMLAAAVALEKISRKRTITGNQVNIHGT